jgi:leader peptidase (prepilin peptidase)/N-methyltransferase
MQPGLVEYLAVFVLGTMIGSFLNVVIYRVPAGISIVKPASHCPQCQRPVKPWENIPILSWLLLRGRCAGCKKPISVRYPAVEAAMGLLAALMFSRFGWSWDALFFSVLAALLLALSAIDIATYRLPNPITLTGAILGVILTVVFRRSELVKTLIGAGVGIGLLLFMALVGQLLFRKETLGIGDVKLAGMVGLFLGPWKTAGMFFVGVFAGALIGGTLALVGGKGWGSRLPFGPYLAAGAIVSLLWGDKLFNVYLHLVLPR